MVHMIIVGTHGIKWVGAWAVRHSAVCGTVPPNEALSCVLHDSEGPSGHSCETKPVYDF